MKKVYIDKRPLWLLFFIRFKNFFFLILLILAFLLALTYSPQGISQNGYRAILIFAFCGVLWATNVVPPSITGFIAIVLIPLLNILPPKKTFALFGNEPVFFILSAFIIALAMERSFLSKRITFFFLSIGGVSEKKLVLSLYLVGGILSFFMPEHAVAAMLLPIVKELANNLQLEKRKSNLGKLLFLSLAWGTIIGGITTFLGGARNALAVGLLEEIGGKRIGFMEWVGYSFPLVVFLFITGIYILFIFYKPEKISLENAKKSIKQELAKLPPFTFKEIFVSIIIAATIVGWTAVGHKGLGLAVISLFSSILFFVFGIIEWKDAERNLSWGTIFMYGGAITLGSAFSQTDASEYLISKIFVDGTSFILFAFLSGFLALLLTEFMSNAAVVALLMPLVLKIGINFNYNLNILTVSVALMSGLAFTLPIGTPSHTIAYSSGYYSIWDSLKAGFIMNIFAVIGLFVCLKLFW